MKPETGRTASQPRWQQASPAHGPREAALVARAKDLGYEVRYMWLGGKVGSTCFLRGKRLLLLDPQASPAERMEYLRQVVEGSIATRQMESHKG